MQEIAFGVIGPVFVAAAAWAVMKRAYRASPQRLMTVMVVGFAAKILIFGAYLAVMLRVMALRPVPFAAALVGSLIALYCVDAFRLRKLFS
jgi:hypothetical protein